jgi:hypothetical protein
MEVSRLLTVLSALLAVADLAEGRRGSSSTAKSVTWRMLESDCRRACQNFGEECTLFCKAPVCYLKAFGLPPGYQISPEVIKEIEAEAGVREPLLPKKPIEPGEVDADKSNHYSTCLKRLEKALKQNQGWPPILDKEAGHLRMPQGLFQNEEFGPLLKIASVAAVAPSDKQEL